MPKFKIVTPNFQGALGYAPELEALEGLDAVIVETPMNEDAFIAEAKDADAIYGKGMPVSKRIIDSLTKCKVISLGSVGVDSVDVKAATAAGRSETGGESEGAVGGGGGGASLCSGGCPLG